ncbi:MAG: DUF1684 domain-containing protein [Ignavibacteriales bacterium]|nr:DUF1684 domain-containing protein [Ignavibacteriales bacterium]
MRKFLRISLSLIFISLIVSCQKSLEEKGEAKYIQEIKDWHNKRIDNLKKENGWLNLAGLFWLNEGVNKFGSDKTNDIIFPEGKAPAFIGTLTLKDSIVTLRVSKSIEVKSEGKIVTTADLKNDIQGATILEYGSLRWFVIKRGNKYGIRLRDLENLLVKSFKGIETYPINSDWRFEAELEKYDPPKKIEITNILGMIEEDISPGALVFTKDGKQFKLDALVEDNQYFIIFADETSGDETYGAGRFIYVNKNDSTGKIILDFNKAFNPPCVFTKYATCPLPPKQNHLKLKVTAGELMFKGGAH